ncbi:unnamed protein product [Allacma fusca]|uniref:Uncharacterized protein n=1 Tax=Allacma fusca TaxID=39272 RepID=A0A8J2JSD7_9HEXA|nr:unnamed protein product [Allacma fusca]
MDEDNQELTDEGEEEETLEPFVDYINLDPEITEQAEDLYNLYKVELIGQPQIVETDKEKVTRAIQKVYRENKKKSSKKTMDNADVPAPKISKPQVLPNNAVEAEPEIVGADPPEVEVKIFDLDDIEEEDETKIEPSRNNADTDVFSITELRPRESQDASRLLLRTSSSLTFRRSKENIKVEPGNQGPIPKLDEDPSKRGSKKITTIVSNPDEQNKNNLEGVSKKQLNSKSSQTGWTGTCGSKKNSSTQETPQTRKNSSNRPNKDTLGCENLPYSTTQDVGTEGFPPPEGN